MKTDAKLYLVTGVIFLALGILQLSKDSSKWYAWGYLLAAVAFIIAALTSAREDKRTIKRKEKTDA